MCKHVGLLSVCPIQTSMGRSLQVIMTDKTFLNESFLYGMFKIFPESLYL